MASLRELGIANASSHEVFEGTTASFKGRGLACGTDFHACGLMQAGAKVMALRAGEGRTQSHNLGPSGINSIKGSNRINAVNTWLLKKVSDIFFKHGSTNFRIRVPT